MQVFRPFFVAIALAAAAASPPSRAQSRDQQKQSFAVWKKQDDCSRQAFQRFPDYTAEANRQRERALAECLASGRLPPRQSLLPEEGPRQGSSSRPPTAPSRQ